MTKLTDKYPAEEIKRLYSLRWGIETSFRDLKYTMGMLDFHSKKVECIQQDIYAHLIMYNFAEMITSHVAIKKKQSRKYTYKANFSVAAHMCRKYYRGITSPPDLETIIFDKRGVRASESRREACGRLCAVRLISKDYRVGLRERENLGEEVNLLAQDEKENAKQALSWNVPKLQVLRGLQCGRKQAVSVAL